jgi:RND family efflux transporter MFP subunit
MKKIIWGVIGLVLGLQAGEVYATFTVEAQKSAQLAFNASGIVGNVNIDIGSVVKENEILATLESDDINASLQLAKTQFKYAKKDFERQLKVKHLVDQESLDQYANKYESAKDQVILQQALFDKTILKAPFEGIIFWKELEVGDTVSGALLRTVLKVQSLYARKLVLSFDQKYWKEIKVGDAFSYKLDGDSRQYEGKIVKVYPSADANNRKMQAEVHAKDLPVGLFGDGLISTQMK